MKFELQFVTGTSTLALYGQGTLDARLEDDPDWWTLDWEDLPEVNTRALRLFELGADGSYQVRVSTEPHSEQFIDMALARVQGQGFRAPDGQVYVGAGYCLPADGLRPDEKVKEYGRFFQIPPGDYLVGVLRLPPGSNLGAEMVLRLVPQSGDVGQLAPNQFRLTPAGS